MRTPLDAGAGKLHREGFSLVEVTLALGVVAFGFVAIFGLIPVGLTSFRQSIDTSVGAQIAQVVLNDAAQTDFDQLILGAKGKTNETFRKANALDTSGQTLIRYFDDQAVELPPTKAAQALYHVNTRVTPATPLPKSGTATSDNTNLATVTVQVANNPGNQTLDLSTADAMDQNSPLRNLWTGAYKSNPQDTRAVSLVTYSAVVSRNK